MIVVDTHAWVWLTDEAGRLSAAARGAIGDASTVLVSAASCLEIATLVRRGRLGLDRPAVTWIRQALMPDRIEHVAADIEIAAYAGALPDPFPGDPADRLIYATAAIRGVRLVTADRAIRELDPARTIW
ncbi:MAG: type II toxin-antitoxin system VapC family toxin [Thermoleophilaceae bacterium]